MSNKINNIDIDSPIFTKTVLNELISIISLINNIPPKPLDKSYVKGYSDAFNIVFYIIEQNDLIESERRHILEAYSKGKMSEYYFNIKGGYRITAEDYFDSKYGNPQGDPETKQ
ncbi:TPA: hypothetical protein ACGQK4_002183 [Elizabethkingia anophelis]|nr:hypothetical protein [Elizabethkingia anophelis]